MSFVVNVYFLYFPILGIPKSSISAWLADWSGSGRFFALLAGAICGLGNTCVVGPRHSLYACMQIASVMLAAIALQLSYVAFVLWHRSDRHTALADNQYTVPPLSTICVLPQVSVHGRPSSRVCCSW